MSDERVDVTFGARIADLKAGMADAQTAVKNSTQRMKAHVESLNTTVESVKVPFIALLAVLAGGAMFKESIEKVAELGERLNVLGQETGLTAESLTRLRYAADLSDVSVETLDVGLKRLARSMQEAAKGGAGPATDAFTAMGIAVRDADGSLRPMDAVLLDVADHFQRYENGAAKSALAMNLFGRSGADLIPLLNQGREGIAALEREADRLGVTMSGADVEAALEYDDAMKRVNAEMSAAERTIVLALMPALTAVAEAFTESAAGAEVFKAIGSAIGNVVKGLATVVNDATLAVKLFWIAMRAGSDPVKALGDAKAALAEWQRVLDTLANPPEKPRPTGRGGNENTPTPPDREGMMRAFEQEWLELKAANAENFGDMTAEELKFWSSKLKLVEKGSKEYLAIYRRVVDLSAQADKEAYAGKLAALNAEEELNKESLATVLEIRQAELEIIRKHFKEASKEVQDGIARVNEVQARMRKASAKEWEETFNAIPKAFSKAAGGIGKEIFSLRDLFRAFFKDLVAMGVQAGAASVRNWAATELAKKNITLSSVAARVAAETWGAIQSVALGAWAALKNIANYAAQAIAAAWAAISAIPLVGPFLAPAVAAGAGIAVLGLAGQVKSAAGGYDIPAGINPMTQLHASEMVLPADLANIIRGMAKQGGGGPGGGAVVHIHAMDAQSFRDFAKRNPEGFGDGVAAAIGTNHGGLNRALRTRGG